LEGLVTAAAARRARLIELNPIADQVDATEAEIAREKGELKILESDLESVISKRMPPVARLRASIESRDQKIRLLRKHRDEYRRLASKPIADDVAAILDAPAPPAELPIKSDQQRLEEIAAASNREFEARSAASAQSEKARKRRPGMHVPAVTGGNTPEAAEAHVRDFHEKLKSDGHAREQMRG
jgi:hypothetical protein